MPVLVATITPNPEQMDAVEAVLRDVVPSVHTEDGCELYALHRGKEKFVFVEKWRDMAALAAHGTGPNIKAMNERLAGLVAGRPHIEMVEAVPLGDERKGGV
jgi:quinol monooxygenase YgiN